MINFDQAYFQIQKDFIMAYGHIAAKHVENVYCATIERVPNTLNRLRLWKNAALQEAKAVHTIMDYEKRTNGKTN